MEFGREAAKQKEWWVMRKASQKPRNSQPRWHLQPRGPFLGPRHPGVKPNLRAEAAVYLTREK